MASKFDRLGATVATIRTLLAKSGNLCAFPGCTNVLFNDDNIYVGNLCHIEAASRGGERFNEGMTDEERRHYDNLVFLCPQHHKETNDVSLYPVERLKHIKYEHESRFGSKPFKINEEQLYKLVFEMEQYWSSVAAIAATQETLRHYPVPVDVERPVLSIFQDLKLAVGRMDELARIVDENNRKLPELVEHALVVKGVPQSLVQGKVPYSLGYQSWAYLVLGFGNLKQVMLIDITILEIKHLEEYLKTNHSNAAARARLAGLKDELVELTKTATIYD